MQDSRSAILAIVGIGAALRCFNLDHGLPELVAVDAFKFVDEAVRIAGSGNWTPRYYQYPGLLTHILAVLYRIVAPDTVYWRHLLASIVLAIAGTGLIPATWLLARRICRERTAMLAAALTSFSPAMVTRSRTPAPDILMTLGMILCLWLLLDPEPRKRTSAGAGTFAGVALDAKFSALYLLPFLVIAPLVMAGRLPFRKRLYHPLISLGVMSAVFSLITPQIWFHAGSYIERLVREAAIQKYGQIGRVQYGWLDYLISSTPTWEQPWLGTSIAANLGWPFLGAMLVALVLAFRCRRCSRSLRGLWRISSNLVDLPCGAGSSRPRSPSFSRRR